MAAYQHIGCVVRGTTLGRTAAGVEGRMRASGYVVGNPLRARRPGNHLNNTISMFGKDRGRSSASINDLEVGSAPLLLDAEKL